MEGFQLLGGQRLKSIIFRHGAGPLHPTQEDFGGARI
jgi:hypothetical protein